MELVRNFTQLNKHNADIAGGKGASLGEMTQAGIPVPPGFVVLSNAFERFIQETNLFEEIDGTLDAVNHNEVHTAEAASEKIKGLILSREMPKDIQIEIESSFSKLNTKYVAVRSSATAEDGKDHAWAGQLDSYLNITSVNLLDKVKHCWASLFTPRAIFYRYEKGLHNTKISVAVVVQKMVDSEISGIAFSVHPVTEDRNQLIIEAGFGLGEAIVSGQITPDSYVVEKEPRRILDINVGTQTEALYKNPEGGNTWKNVSEPKASSQVLTEEQILELSEMILNIERHYGFPCDIEWAYEGGRFYIVQSRPITTLKVVENDYVAKENPVEESKKVESLDISNLIRLFQFNGHMPYVYSDRFVNSYKDLDGVAIGDSSFWISYMTDEKRRIAMKGGLDLYSHISTYEKLKKDYKFVFNKGVELKDKIINSKNLDAKDIRAFFDTCTEYGVLYRLTEFFYTDLAFEKKEDCQEIVENFKTFEELKLDGRKKLNEMLLIPNSIFEQVIVKIASDRCIDHSDIFHYSMAEIVDIINGKYVAKDVIDSRKVSYIIYSKNNEIFSVIGSKAKIIMDDLYLRTHSSKELKGQTASKGFVRGKAKVIKVGISNYGNLSEVVDSMEMGQVLVAETTEPSIISACKKASAIVTNQGGMMSHAAIVAREMKIPCVVGTGNATELINDGDMIEVDADRGIVKIIN
ncbi:MAG: PEP/pyruvate-binding domain-containing protein [bacterium]